MEAQAEIITLDEKEVLRDRRFTDPVIIRMVGRALVSGCIFDGPVELHLSPLALVMNCQFRADVEIHHSASVPMTHVRYCAFAEQADIVLIPA